MDKPKEEWEEGLWALLYEEYGDVGQNGNVLAFIKQTLSTHHQKIVGKLEELGNANRIEFISAERLPEIIKSPKSGFMLGYSDAINDVLSIIKSKV